MPFVPDLLIRAERIVVLTERHVRGYGRLEKLPPRAALPLRPMSPASVGHTEASWE